MALNIKSSQYEKDLRNIKIDALLVLIKGLSAADIETYFNNQVSVIATTTDSAIDNYVDNITDLAGAKVALKLLAKDSAFNSNMLKKVTKLVVLLSKSIKP